MTHIITQAISCAAALDLPPPVQPNKKIIHVAAAALIDAQNRVLLAQRPAHKPYAGQWEFPGGKIEAGELPEYALMRELREELAVETRPCALFPIAYASYAYDEFHLLMPLFICRIWRGPVVPQEGQMVQWAHAGDLYKMPLLQADLPLIEPLRQALGNV